MVRLRWPGGLPRRLISAHRLRMKFWRVCSIRRALAMLHGDAGLAGKVTISFSARPPHRMERYLFLSGGCRGCLPIQALQRTGSVPSPVASSMSTAFASRRSQQSDFGTGSAMPDTWILNLLMKRHWKVFGSWPNCVRWIRARGSKSIRTGISTCPTWSKC